MKIFHLIYYNLYKRSQKINGAPEIPVLSYICFLQTSILITLINIVLLLFQLYLNYKIHYVSISLLVALFGLNYYYFEKKGVGQKLLTDKNLDIGRKRILIHLFLFLSIFMEGFSYYLLRELN
ncbi:hypothetical protein SAMN04488008_1172 [Maribacter orientalis]|uniref:Uncharacterized protein n=1 Tax=Maribacter orientalis TaxID=228957 RepID=A0A1H7XFF5_9FLAO|nr:hypothetical protein SAMN04488008_1172 [Maribacter orientalis]